MIKSYNDYIINKDIKPLHEKVDINISNLINAVKEKTEEAKSNVVYSTMTSDAHPVKTKDEYYALFKLDSGDGETPYYTIGKVRITNAYQKKLKNDKTINVYKYELLNINPMLQGTKLNQYKLYITDKNRKRLSENQVSGYYLYQEPKTEKSLNDILKRYGLKSNEDEKQSQRTDIEVGNLYEITTSKGDRIKIIILSIKDGEITARDFENKQDISNLKLKNVKDPKLITTVGKYLNSKINKLKINNWEKSKDYLALKSDDEKVNYMAKKLESLKKIRSYLNRMTDVKFNDTEVSSENKESIEKLKSIIKGLIGNINNKVRKIKGIKPKGNTNSKSIEEPIEDKTETPEEKTQKEDVEKMDQKAKEVQTDIQKPKPVTKKNPIRQEKTPEGTPESVQKPELATTESKKHKNK